MNFDDMLIRVVDKLPGSNDCGGVPRVHLTEVLLSQKRLPESRSCSVAAMVTKPSPQSVYAQAGVGLLLFNFSDSRRGGDINRLCEVLGVDYYSPFIRLHAVGLTSIRRRLPMLGLYALGPILDGIVPKEEEHDEVLLVAPWCSFADHVVCQQLPGLKEDVRNAGF